MTKIGPILFIWKFFFSFALAINIKIDKELRHFVDEFGRVKIFHGVNLVVKIPPYLPKTDKFDPLMSMSSEDFDHFKIMGFNIVRLGILWEAFEIEENKFDFNYLEEVYKLVNKLGENGIIVILDAHQDLFSRIICGEGVPYFYASKLSYEKDCSKSIIESFLHHLDICIPMRNYNLKLDNNSLPLIEECKKHSFMDYHISPELTSLYGRFYQNENELIDKFITFWSYFVKKFKNNPYIFGLDIWNEPFPGDMWSSIKYLIPGKADKEQILPFYKKVNEKLREIDNNLVFIFQPTPFPDTLPFFGGQFAGHFEETPSGDQYLDKQILNAHSYCCQAAREICELGEPQLKDYFTCKSYHLRKLEDLYQNSRALKIPFIVTEFGACRNSESCFNEITSFAEASDNYLASWTYWQYKPFGDFTTSCDYDEGIFSLDGGYQENKVKGLARTYIKAFQGIPISMKFDHKTKIFKSQFYLNSKINASTEIYYSEKIYYENGYNLKIADLTNLIKLYNITYENDNNLLKFKFEKIRNDFKDDRIIDVYVYPKTEITIKVNPLKIDNENNYELSNQLKENISVKINQSNNIEKGNKLLIQTEKIKTIIIINYVIIKTESREINYYCSVSKECYIKNNMIDDLRISISYNDYQYTVEIKYLMNDTINLLLK